MQAVFMTTDGSDTVAGRATWTGDDVVVEADGDEARTAIAHIFRSIPVVTDDPSLRAAGTSGVVQLPPGTLMWFLEVARIRGSQAGFKVGLVPEAREGAAWDPAGTYRPFAVQAERRERPGSQ